MRRLPGRPSAVTSAAVERVRLRGRTWSWRVTFRLACGHELVVDHRFEMISWRYSDGSMLKKRAARLAELGTVPCPACGDGP